MAGAVAHRQRATAHRYAVAIGQPACGAEGLGWRKAEHLRLLREPVDPVLVTRVRADDGQTQFTRQRACAASMVDVRVGQQDLLQLDTQALHRSTKFGQITAGIDNSAVHGLVAPDDGAVLLERRDGDGVVVQHA